MTKSLVALALSMSFTTQAAQKVFTRIFPALKAGLPLTVAGFVHLGNQKPLHAQNIIEGKSPLLKPNLQEQLQELKKTLASLQEIQQRRAADTSPSSFSIQLPQPLTDAEKQIDILERIKKKYIGTLHKNIKAVIAYFTSEKSETEPLSINTVLLHGDPGVGKSYLVKTLAQELQVPYMYCNCTAFLERYFGDSEKKIRRFFATAKQTQAPIILFIDEFESVAFSRDNVQSCGETLSTLLTEIQNLRFDPNVFIFVAVNDKDRLDWAMKSRFNSRMVKIEKISSKEEYVDFFKKSLHDNHFQSDTIEKLATDIYYEIARWSNWSKTQKLSMRDLEGIVPAACDLRRADVVFEKKSNPDFMVNVKAAYKELETI